jgi:hypothetical protein
MATWHLIASAFTFQRPAFVVLLKKCSLLSHVTDDPDSLIFPAY